MSLRLSLVAAVALIGFSVAPALAAQTITIPDPRLGSSNATPPDALFDNSVPDTWQKKSDLSSTNNQTGLGGLHFSVRGSNGQDQQYQPAMNPNSTSYHDPLVPGSEFYQPLPGIRTRISRAKSAILVRICRSVTRSARKDRPN